MFCNDIVWDPRTRQYVSNMSDQMLPQGSELWCALLASRSSAQRSSAQPCSDTLRFRCRRSLVGGHSLAFQQYTDDVGRHEKFQPEGFKAGGRCGKAVQSYQKVFFKVQTEDLEDLSNQAAGGARYSSRRRPGRTPVTEQPSPAVSEPAELLPEPLPADDLVGREVKKYFENSDQGWYEGKVTKSFTTMSWRPFAQQFAVTVSL